MEQQKDMLERCIAHVRASFRQGRVKGLDRRVLSRAFVVESMIEMLGVDAGDAVELARNCVAYAVEKRQFELLTTSKDAVAPK